MVLVSVQPQRLKTEKELVAYAVQRMQPGEKLVFLGAKPFSATFYSQGRAGEISMAHLSNRQAPSHALYLAVPKGDFEQVSKSLGTPLPKVFESRDYVLTVIPRNESNF